MVPAQRLGRYEVLAKLAAGGMGEIFLARLEGAAGFEKLCVIKRILPHLADDSRFRQMMIAEARIASKLSHGNIAQVYELDEIDGQLYIAMEYLEGVTVLAMIRKCARKKQPLDLGLVAGVMAQVCDGLHYAHELKDRDGTSLQVIHRDVTPSNVFVTDTGVAKLLDFGIAKVENVANTESGAIKGKYAYMAPEQLRGLDVDRRADVFACGIVLFEMLALRRLFQRKTDYLTFQAVMEQPLRDVRQYRPDAPDALVEVVMRALASEPAGRFQTTRALRTALLAAIPAQPWGSNEISEFVSANFADDIAKRHSNISQAAKRESRGGSIPTIWSPGSADPDEDDEYFTATSNSGMSSAQFVAAAQSAATNPGHAGSKPRPRITAPTKIEGPPRAATTAKVVASDRKRHHPTKTALAVCGVAAGCAVIATIAFLSLRSHQPAAKPAASDPYSLAIAAHQAVLDRCVGEHGATLPPGARANVLVYPNGRVYEVAFDPSSVATTPLGDCVLDALRSVRFPTATERQQVVIALTAHAPAK